MKAKIGSPTRADSRCALAMVNVLLNISQTRQYRSCRFNARSPYLVCAVHPTGPEQRQCPDFESLTPVAQSSSGSSPQLLAMELDWMRFWGPSNAEWIASWGPEDLDEGDSTSEADLK